MEIKSELSRWRDWSEQTGRASVGKRQLEERGRTRLSEGAKRAGRFGRSWSWDRQPEGDKGGELEIAPKLQRRRRRWKGELKLEGPSCEDQI